jgi:hypothetical protein
MKIENHKINNHPTPNTRAAHDGIQGLLVSAAAPATGLPTIPPAVQAPSPAINIPNSGAPTPDLYETCNRPRIQSLLLAKYSRIQVKYR